MQTSLLFYAPPAPAPLAKPASSLVELVALANDYAADVRSSATRRAYLTDFRSFEAWCQGRGLVSLPAEPATVAVYLAALAQSGKRPSTIQRALAGIAHEHRG